MLDARHSGQPGAEHGCPENGGIGPRCYSCSCLVPAVYNRPSEVGMEAAPVEIDRDLVDLLEDRPVAGAPRVGQLLRVTRHAARAERRRDPRAPVDQRAKDVEDERADHPVKDHSKSLGGPAPAAWLRPRRQVVSLHGGRYQPGRVETARMFNQPLEERLARLTDGCLVGH